MKNLKIIISIIISLLFLTSCKYTELDEIEQLQPTDILKVSTKVKREDLTDGYFTFNDIYDTDSECWITSTGKSIPAKEAFVETELEIGKTYVCAPLSFGSRNNLIIHFEVDGYVEISPDPVDDDRVQLAYSILNPNYPVFMNWTIEKKITSKAPMSLNFCPLGYFQSGTEIVLTDTLVDIEYYLTVVSYNEYKRPTATAKIRLKAIPDKNYPYEKVESYNFGPEEERTRFLEIELVSCEYGDTRT